MIYEFEVIGSRSLAINRTIITYSRGLEVNCLWVLCDTRFRSQLYGLNLQVYDAVYLFWVWWAVVYSYELSSLPDCVYGQSGVPNSWCNGCACRYRRRTLGGSAVWGFGEYACSLSWLYCWFYFGHVKMACEYLFVFGDVGIWSWVLVLWWCVIILLLYYYFDLEILCFLLLNLLETSGEF